MMVKSIILSVITVIIVILFLTSCVTAPDQIDETPEQLPTRFVCTDEQAAMSVARAWQQPDDNLIMDITRRMFEQKRCGALKTTVMVTKDKALMDYVDKDGDDMAVWRIVRSGRNYFVIVVRKLNSRMPQGQES